MAASNGRLPDSVLTTIPWATNFRVAKTVLPSLIRLNTAFFAAFGHDLVVNAAYRDYATQVAYYKNPPSGKGTAAKPGTSNHGWGVAVDFHLTANEYAWMMAHANGYGWSNPEWARNDNPADGAKEPWHWENQNSYVPDSNSTTPNNASTAARTPRRVLMIVLIQAQRGYWLVGPGYEHQLNGEEWNQAIGPLRDDGLIGQKVFEDGPVGQRRFDLARHAISGQA